MTKKKKKQQTDSEPHAEILDQDNVVDASSEGVEEEQASEADTIKDLEQKNSDCQDKLMRLAAEFENYKKRQVREREAYLKYAEENILKELLPCVDNLERALAPETEAGDLSVIQQGVELTLKGLLSTINKFGLEPIDSVGKPFDPNFHEALVMENSDDIPDQHIIKEFEKGYQYKDRLLRAAKVVVSKGKE